MKTIQYNKSNLTEDKIQRKVNKVRAILINDKGQCLLTKYTGLYMLPGGGVEEGENEQQAIAREILEETGIEIDSDKAIKFLRIKSYDANYYDRVQKKEINRLTDTIFYEIHTCDDINESNKRLTQSEKEKNHQVKFVNLSKIEYMVQTNISNNPKKPIFDREILTALREYREFKSKQLENNEKGMEDI